MGNNLQLEFEIALEKLRRKVMAEDKLKKHELGAAAEPASVNWPQDPDIKSLDFEWAVRIGEESRALDLAIEMLLAKQKQPAAADLAELTPDKIWVWGGPTPSWGGSMAKDTLVRGADYFQARNVVYVYGETSDEMLSQYAKYDKVLCQVNSNCRTKGCLANTEEENAELLSKLSLKYPNIKGAMCDDFCTGSFSLLLPERYEKIWNGVKKHNPGLDVYGVIYAHDLRDKNFSLIQQYIDVVNLWLWCKDDLLRIDETMDLCRKHFPGKRVIMGIFLHEYGRADIANPPALLTYQLTKAREYLKKGWIEGIIILGDREIRKWPRSAEAVRNYLKSQK